MDKGLTKRQRTVLEFLKDFIKDFGYPPTLREISGHLGIKGPKNARKHLEALEKKGFLKRSANFSRAIEVFTAPVKDAVTVPVAGRVRAGSPQLAIEDITERVTLDGRFFNLNPEGGAFLLKVEGESMTGAGIDDGDHVLVRPQKSAETGEIVVAMLDDEATIKRFFTKGDTITLKPENPEMEPLTIKRGTREFSIIGKVLTIIKRL